MLHTPTEHKLQSQHVVDEGSNVISMRTLFAMVVVTNVAGGTLLTALSVNIPSPQSPVNGLVKVAVTSPMP